MLFATIDFVGLQGAFFVGIKKVFIIPNEILHADITVFYKSKSEKIKEFNLKHYVFLNISFLKL